MCGRLGVWLARYLGVAKFEFWTFVASGIVGFFLFHCQHTFEGAMRKKPENWSFFENGMNSCSYLQVPFFLKYGTVATLLDPCTLLFPLKMCGQLIMEASMYPAGAYDALGVASAVVQRGLSGCSRDTHNAPHNRHLHVPGCAYVCLCMVDQVLYWQHRVPPHPPPVAARPDVPSAGVPPQRWGPVQERAARDDRTGRRVADAHGVGPHRQQVCARVANAALPCQHVGNDGAGSLGSFSVCSAIFSIILDCDVSLCCTLGAAMSASRAPHRHASAVAGCGEYLSSSVCHRVERVGSAEGRFFDLRFEDA